MRIRLFLLWVSPLLLATLLLTVLGHRAIGARESRTYWNDTIADRVRELVGREYVDELDPEKERELFYAAMQGYLRALDPYCAFFDPDDRKAMEEENRGEFGGIGVLVRDREDGKGLLVTGLRRDDPAERAGVRLGDHIVAVDGESVIDVPMEEITDLIRGRPGSEVAVGLDRDGEALTLTMRRSEIKIDSVVGVRMVDPERGIGYFRVVSFQENTGADAREALERLKKQGLRSLILDLRQNRGGVLEKGAVALVDLFLLEGPIVQTRGRGSESRRVYGARAETTVCPTEPLVVLVDGNSASASEVVAGAFQDHRRGILLGERTFGKFLVQSIHPLPDLDVALALTTARYYTPYGRWLQRRDDEKLRGGLMPDVRVERTPEETEALYRDTFARQYGLAMRVAEPAETGEDRQLERAVQILRDHAAVTADGK